MSLVMTQPEMLTPLAIDFERVACWGDIRAPRRRRS